MLDPTTTTQTYPNIQSNTYLQYLQSTRKVEIPLSIGITTAEYQEM